MAGAAQQELFLDSVLPNLEWPNVMVDQSGREDIFPIKADGIQPP